MEYREITPDAWRKLIREFVDVGPPSSGGAERQTELLRLVLAPYAHIHHTFEANAQDLIEYNCPFCPQSILHH
jgi:hypothetical protein